MYSKAIIYVSELILTPFNPFDIWCKKLNPLIANTTKCSNTINNQRQSTICRLVLKGFIWRISRNDFKLYNIWNKYIYRKDYLRGYWLKEGLSFCKYPKEENLKQQCLIKIKCRNIQSIRNARMCNAYFFGLNPGWK